MNVEKRRREVRVHGYCQNCLARSHSTNDCTSADVCQKCGWAHHTLLHQSPQAAGSSRDAQHSGPRPSTTRNELRTPRGSSVHHRLGPYRRSTPQSHRNRDSSLDRNRRPVTEPTPNPRRILLGALRALERLAKSL